MLTPGEAERDHLHQLVRGTPAHIAIVNLINDARHSGYAEAVERLRPEGLPNPITGEIEPNDGSWSREAGRKVDASRDALVKIILEMTGKLPPQT